MANKHKIFTIAPQKLSFFEIMIHAYSDRLKWSLFLSVCYDTSAVTNVQTQSSSNNSTLGNTP